MRLILIAAACLMCARALAADLVIEAPTEYEDGTEIRAGELVGFRLECAAVSGGTYQVVHTTTDASRTHTFELGLAPGRWYCMARARTTNLLFSQPSNEVVIDIEGDDPVLPTARPRAPFLVEVRL